MSTFRRVFEDNYELLHRMARQSCRDRDDVTSPESILSSTYRRLAHQDPGAVANEKAFLRRVIACVAIDKIRRHVRSHQRQDANFRLADDLLAQDGDQQVDERTEAFISRAMDSLPNDVGDQLKTIAILYWLDELTHQQIAAATGLTVSQVGTRIAKIKKSLERFGREHDLLD